MNQPVKSQSAPSLLTKRDPEPYTIINAESDFPIVLVCEHAGQAIPEKLNGLGISKTALDSHIGWDIGAKGVTLGLAKALGAPAILQSYSRLVIDCNRPVIAVDAMPEVSDRVVIPANQDITASERQARVDEIFTPFHSAIDALVARAPRRALLSIHSFTPSLRGVRRPWDIGFLYRHDTHTSSRLAAHIHDQRPELKIGMQEPYLIDDESDWFVPVHGEARGIAHSLIEIRNDHITTSYTQANWVALLAETMQRLLKEI